MTSFFLQEYHALFVCMYVFTDYQQGVWAVGGNEVLTRLIVFFCFLRKKLNARFVCVSTPGHPPRRMPINRKPHPARPRPGPGQTTWTVFFCDRVKDILKRRHERGERQRQYRQQHRQ